MLTHLLTLLLLLVPSVAEAGTLDDIARLEKKKEEMPPSPPAEPAPVWFRLADGRPVNISHWQIVHFLRSDCVHCHRFNPVLKSVAQQTGLNVFVFSFDGMGDAIFPKVVPVSESVVKDFFAELPRATPTDFLINTRTLVTIPLSQGDISEEALKQRLMETFALAVELGVQ
ncbi:type-F conjugative transfer system pilin assembly thiol-disulfide isomerase TrbB [Pantoea cypripedii]|uniref:Type-F conjugative transfer system pilin assembly thiol-disulfide isomerase TrbB n=1 Tax=Pantoea cypripedii TaxID=55209 RepID=A0A1X1EKK8_PANCY|nr:type-F conjugative transfer system pilin assembly thiol-disulfide isomerase TrbB [Pantoea cypripedii]MBP2199056.1 type-F conjugative transfer system pilin assembly thiol-disulfide isomerase TrbB [Pantoea cypripedii]ORM89465.1 type-F conjugative transfer system pilin assembly thiol-disulfide isomerase TrbB [Pantoea cypripedii]